MNLRPEVVPPAPQPPPGAVANPVATPDAHVAEHPVNPLLAPHGVVWTEIDGVTEEDAETSRIIWSALHERGCVKNPMEYFTLMFTTTMAMAIVTATNANLVSARKTETNLGEILSYLGIRLTSALEQRTGSVREWFMSGSDRASRSVKEPGAYEKKFGVKRHRFNDIRWFAYNWPSHL
jgi:hypothetical protein